VALAESKIGLPEIEASKESVEDGWLKQELIKQLCNQLAQLEHCTQ